MNPCQHDLIFSNTSPELLRVDWDFHNVLCIVWRNASASMLAVVNICPVVSLICKHIWLRRDKPISRKMMEVSCLVVPCTTIHCKADGHWPFCVQHLFGATTSGESPVFIMQKKHQFSTPEVFSAGISLNFTKLQLQQLLLFTISVTVLYVVIGQQCRFVCSLWQ